jgi:hypothetical protein
MPRFEALPTSNLQVRTDFFPRHHASGGPDARSKPKKLDARPVRLLLPMTVFPTAVSLEILRGDEESFFGGVLYIQHKARTWRHFDVHKDRCN